MKVVILAGGLPSTLIEKSEGVPKPMAEIGERPIIWHIMKYFSSYEHNEFVVCGGYKVELIKEYFMNFYYHQSDITVDLSNNSIHIHKKEVEDWKVTVVDTGLNANVVKRILAVEDIVGNEDFFVCFGDVISNINLDRMVKIHRSEGKYATLAVSRPSGRNTILPITKEGFRAGAAVEDVVEDAWVNSGNMLITPSALKYLKEHNTLEHALFHMGNDEELSTYFHEGFWLPMETIRDRDILNRMWNEKRAPWKVWE